jgi:adenylate kinase family enzyme
MKRVIIIGCPGSGKSTFARKLAERINLPLEHLDLYYHDNKHDYANDRPAWLKLITNLVSKETWIIDGNYKSTFDLRFERADTIIFFDYPRYITVWRTIKRRIQLHGKQRADMPSNWREKIEASHAKFVWTFNKTERPRIYSYLKKYEKGREIVVFRHPREAEEWLDVTTSSR